MPITEEDFDQLKIARSLLVDALAFEQKFELVLSNWLALESYATALSLSSQVESWTSLARSSESFNGLNRHLMNLLSTARSYIDQVKGDFKDAPLRPTFKERAKTMLSEAYDASFDYRFMEGLRNYVQHSSLPVHRVSPNTDAETWAEAIGFYALRSEMEQASHRGFKAPVWAEMKNINAFDLRKTARSYVGLLSKVHHDLRELVTLPVIYASGAFRFHIYAYKAAGATSIIGLRAYAATSRGEKSVPILLDWEEVRVALAMKNSRPIALDGTGPPPGSIRR